MRFEEMISEFKNGQKIRQAHWDKNEYYQFKNGEIYDQDNKATVLDGSQISADDWEIYKNPESEIDWDYIIKNNCLCWFWDDDKNYKVMGFLVEVNKKNKFPFLIYLNDSSKTYCKNCRPVRRDEIVFYKSRNKEKPAIGSFYKGGIYIGEYNGKEVIMLLEDEPEEMTWNEAMTLEGRRPLSILEWKIYEENKEMIDKALKKYGDPLECWYWSSSEGNNYLAWRVRPSDGSMYTYRKNSTNTHVRCVLTF